jgi:hypothetical protein
MTSLAMTGCGSAGLEQSVDFLLEAAVDDNVYLLAIHQTLLHWIEPSQNAPAECRIVCMNGAARPRSGT